MVDIFTQLRVRTGHDFTNYKRATILRRIERRLGLRELPNLAAYARYLQEQSQEVHLLMKDLLISVTNFFRDAEAIEELKRSVVDKILEHKEPNEPIRIWVAGCATGEEAYSIAMLLSEQAAEIRSATNLQVFATDLDQEAIQIAREGYYKEAEVADVSVERLRRFFTREAEGYRVRRELRESILFAAHNVIKDPPFSHLDLVSCRNLLIYLNRKAQGRILEILHFALNPGGYLFLGASESIEGSGDLFVAVNKDHNIYQSRPVPPRAFPIPELSFRPTMIPFAEREETHQEKRAIERLSYADLHQRMLETYAPPSVIVNEEYDIVHLSDRAGRYMQLSGGEPSHNLLKVIKPELRLELRTALYQAVNDRTNVEVRDLRVSTDEGVERVNVFVRPVLREEDTSRGFILVLFEEVKELEPVETEEPIVRSSEPIARRLEEELVHSRAQLRATVEQYEIQQEELRASNEELQAMNEELRSAAEELETSKEELQSVNEELTTVNQELKIKIEELRQANNNFTNLMNSTNVGTIFLDRSLRVRQFTPSAKDNFNLISTDIGRPLMDITSKLREEDLVSDLETVLGKLQTIEREVKVANGHSYIMRLSPYRTLDHKIDGVVMTMFDVTELTRTKEDLQTAREELESRVEERTRELAETNAALRNEVAERKRSEELRRQLHRQLVNTQEDERRRFARDLHDQLGQRLTSLRLKLDSLRSASGGRKQRELVIDQLQDILRRLDADVDFLAWQMRPLALDDLGLAPTLSNYVKQWSEHFGIAAQFRAGEGIGRLDSQIETNLYRIVQEALNNCAKHAKCSRADVLLEIRDRHAVLIVEDDGVGFDPQEKMRGDGQWGLIGMRERAALLSGSIEIESSPDSGATIFVRVPMSQPARPERKTDIQADK